MALLVLMFIWRVSGVEVRHDECRSMMLLGYIGYQAGYQAAYRVIQHDD